VVRRRVALARQLEQGLDGRADDHDLGLGRPAAPHRHDYRPPCRSEATRDVPGDGGLAHPLARADHPERRDIHERRGRRVEPEVGAFVGKPQREHATCKRKALAWAENGLVRQVEDEVACRSIAA
jgi:hypothetical protein